MQTVAFLANLGWADKAGKAAIAKLSDAASPCRFPAFFGPGHDWLPDHNWGGSGMVGLQEMLMQCNGRRILLCPAWPAEWDCDFKLHAPDQTTVEGRVELFEK